MPGSQPQVLRSLEEQRAEYAFRRGLAMPLAELVVWTLIGVAGAFLPPILAVSSLFIGAGFIAYLGIMFSRFTGENFLDNNKPKNVLDSCSSTALRRHYLFTRSPSLFVAATTRHCGWRSGS